MLNNRNTSLFFLMFLSSLVYSQAFLEQSENLGVTASYGPSISEGGGGISFADFNSDGLDDLSFATSDGLHPVFYINKGTHFELVSPSFVEDNGEGKQIIWVDYDADGHKDIFLTSQNSENRLYRNDGNFFFTDVTLDVGLPLTVDESFGANFGDLDFDGDLELYVTSYEDINRLYSYNTNLDMFEDITYTSNISNGLQQTFDCVFFDSDLDGDLDIYVINDKAGNYNALYMNIGGNVFVDISVPSNTNLDLFSMNAGVGDFNLDGLTDIYITSQEDAVLFKNLGNNLYTDVASSANVEIDGWAWAANFLDYDNDNDIDLYAGVEFSANNRPNPFFVNNGNETFSEPFFASGGLTGSDNLSSGSNAVGDIDNNGYIDIVSYKSAELGINIFVNHEHNNDSSFKLELIGTDAHPQAWGARVNVHLTDGTIIMKHKHCSESFLSQNSEYLHFGIKANQVIDFVNITWPYNNSVEVISGADINMNSLNKIVENSGVTESTEYSVCVDTGEIAMDPLSSSVIGAQSTLTYNGTVLKNSNSILKSESEILLGIGFNLDVGAIFEAKIDVCNN